MKNLSELSNKELIDEYEIVSADYAFYLSQILKRITEKSIDTEQNERFIELQKNISISIMDKLNITKDEFKKSSNVFFDTIYNNNR